MVRKDSDLLRNILYFCTELFKIQQKDMESVLVTGASGFIGSFICSDGLKRGFDVWAGMRGTSSRRYLQDKRLRFAELDFSNFERLCQQLRSYKKAMNGRGWDYVVHAAGATKSLTREGFFRTNTEGTKHLVRALIAEDMLPRRFVFVSSLSVFGAVREHPYPYHPILDTDTPQPNTIYGQSKLAAERFLQEITDFPWVILRPTGVYGPREKDYFMMAQSLRQHVDFAVGYRPQDITFVYVSDVVDAVFLAMQAEAAIGHAYFLTDGRVYDSRRFSDLLKRELGNPAVLRVRAPLWFLRSVCAASGTICGIFGRMSTLNLDKYHILAQRNWQCDIEPARRDLGYSPKVELEEGVRRSIAWYREEGWL